MTRDHSLATASVRGRVLRPKLFGGGTGLVAHIEGSRPRSWQHVLWLLMTAAGVLLLIYAALYV